MKTNTNNKPVAIWIDDSMFHERDRDLYEWQLKEAEEEAENKFEFHYFESDDDAIPFVIDNAQRIFLFIQDSFRRPGSIIPAWKKLRERPGPSLGLSAGDFYTYVIDSFSPQSGNVFAGFSFSSEENDLIRDWSSCDSRIILADKMRLTYSKFPEEISPIAKIALEQLDRWHQSTTKDTSEEMRLVAPLAEEMAVLCGVKPERLDHMTPRQFEKLIASLFKNHGFDVELTAATCDGGYDIVAAAHSSYEKEIMLIEVKHFAAHRPVGVGIVRCLYGVKALNKASRAILVTSSYVSEYAKSEFSRVIPWELDFVERKTLIDWCRSYVSELLMDDNFTEQANPADAKKPRR